MSSSQRASPSLTTAFVLRKNAWHEELKEPVANADAGNKKMKLDGRTIGDSGTLSQGLSPILLASRVKWQFHPASTECSGHLKHRQ